MKAPKKGKLLTRFQRRAPFQRRVSFQRRVLFQRKVPFQRRVSFQSKMRVPAKRGLTVFSEKEGCGTTNFD